MGCPSCGTESPASAKFCMGCGAALAGLCPACGHQNPPAARFCMDCGGALGVQRSAFNVQRHPGEQSDPARAEVPTHLADKILAGRAALEGERKQVTALFADIKGSTELIEGLDPEEVRALLEPALRTMMDAVHRFEGTVNHVLGDGIMALLGAPLAHEDHAARACYAALALQEAMRSYGEQVRAAQGLELQARVGLNSGEVVVGTISNELRMEYRRSARRSTWRRGWSSSPRPARSG